MLLLRSFSHSRESLVKLHGNSIRHHSTQKACSATAIIVTVYIRSTLRCVGGVGFNHTLSEIHIPLHLSTWELPNVPGLILIHISENYKVLFINIIDHGARNVDLHRGLPCYHRHHRSCAARPKSKQKAATSRTEKQSNSDLF